MKVKTIKLSEKGKTNLFIFGVFSTLPAITALFFLGIHLFT
jgi:hypothetical protein